MIFDYLKQYGLKITWEALIYNNSHNTDFTPNTNIKEDLLKDLDYYEISSLYEDSLAYVDKLNKKENGQYYTPKDVCEFLAMQTEYIPNGIWCDPCCGIGNISYEVIKRHPDLLDTMIFCDIDKLALKICRYLFSKFFNKDYNSLNNFYNINFLTSNLNYDYIIMNPPYIKPEGEKEDLYISFMKKACQCKGFISITPQTFNNSSEKSSKELRKLIYNFSNIKIYNFDNIPGTIFNGKKKGTFNSNNSNSVRAAITICNNIGTSKLITPLIRWKNEQRNILFSSIDKFLTVLVYDNIFYKLYPKTEFLLLKKSNIKLKDLLSKTPTNFCLIVPATPRYYITASMKNLNRSSKHILFFKNANDMLKAYIVLNSSYSYWWWRINDGCITLTKNVLYNMPIDDIVVDTNLVNRLMSEENTNLVVKMNAGKPNENVKHSQELVKDINMYLGYYGLESIQNNTML